MSRSKTKRRLLTGTLAIVIPIAVLVGMWYPEYRHHYIPTISVDPPVVEASRQLPADSLLVELSHFEYLPIPSGDELIAQAEGIVAGRLKVSGDATVSISAEFDPSELEEGPAYQRLMIASLIPTAILLRAYDLTGREEFFDTARNRLLSFAAHERSTVIPRGYLRNDHATSARAGVLALFWKSYRAHSSYDPDAAQILLEMVCRTGQFLSKPSHFRYQSNHGIMQNIALLQVSLAFPGIPESDHVAELAVTRLQDQMGFYINDEGVVLEHSAGYQAEGMKLLATIFRYLVLLDEPVPADWQAKYKKGMEFLSSLRRPDNSLPLIGDTQIGSEDYPPEDVELPDAVGVRRQPPTPFGLYPAAGYALRWGGLSRWPDSLGLSQTCIAWSYYPGHGHKQADEMNVRVWADGCDWWSSAGYWPYDTPGETMSRSWSTSNAPHLVSENVPDPINGNFFSDRSTELTGFASTDSVTALQMDNKIPLFQFIQGKEIGSDMFAGTSFLAKLLAENLILRDDGKGFLCPDKSGADSSQTDGQNPIIGCWVMIALGDKGPHTVWL